jgi:recombination protein RecT
MAETKQTPAVNTGNGSKEITAMVLDKIQAFTSSGELKLPADYSPENAIKSAQLMLTEQKDSSGKPVLETCTRESIANCLLDMVVQGLSPLKKQCYFIPYGNKLTLSRSYMGTIAVAQRVGGVKSINAQLIYQDDEFQIGIDPETGGKTVIMHIQELKNIDDNKIVGAYAIVILNDGKKFCEVMTMPQIEKAWQQGATKGNSPAHKNFKGEMSKKSVINRALKLFINSSSDASLYEEDEQDVDPITAKVNHEILTNANKEELGHTEDQEVIEVTNLSNVVHPDVTEGLEAKNPATKVESKDKTTKPELQF